LTVTVASRTLLGWCASLPWVGATYVGLRARMG
jgi:hypothetical protein